MNRNTVCLAVSSPGSSRAARAPGFRPGGLQLNPGVGWRLASASFSGPGCLPASALFADVRAAVLQRGHLQAVPALKMKVRALKQKVCARRIYFYLCHTKLSGPDIKNARAYGCLGWHFSPGRFKSRAGVPRPSPTQMFVPDARGLEVARSPGRGRGL